MTSTITQVRQKYRSLVRLVNKLPESQLQQGLEELRSSFRLPLGQDESLDKRLEDADKRESFLRMITPKEKSSNQSGVWVYKDGKRLEGHASTRMDANGKVHSNWDGKNLDPCSVKRHNQQLKRAGFVNNSHAKGYF